MFLNVFFSVHLVVKTFVTYLFTRCYSCAMCIVNSVSFTIKCNENEFQDKHQTAAAAVAASPHLERFQETNVLKFLQSCKKFRICLNIWLFVCLCLFLSLFVRTLLPLLFFIFTISTFISVVSWLQCALVCSTLCTCELYAFRNC